MRKAGTVSGSGSCETIDRRSGFRWNNRQETFSQRAVNLIALVTSTAAICNSGVYIDFIQLPRLTRVAGRGAGGISSQQKRSSQRARYFPKNIFHLRADSRSIRSIMRGRQPLFLDTRGTSPLNSIFHPPSSPS